MVSVHALTSLVCLEQQQQQQADPTAAQSAGTTAAQPAGTTAAQPADPTAQSSLDQLLADPSSWRPFPWGTVHQGDVQYDRTWDAENSHGSITAASRRRGAPVLGTLASGRADEPPDRDCQASAWLSRSHDMAEPGDDPVAARQS